MYEGFGLLAFILAIASIAYFKSILIPKIKGYFGESIVAIHLKRLNSKRYLVLHDVLIQNDVRSSQIDHIVVSKYGIFVIETKNYSGWIFGNERYEQWTQTLFKKKYKFRNPVFQCWGHVTTLKSVLSDLHYTPYLPIVVFTGNSTLKHISASIPIVKSRRLIKTIKRHSKTEHLPNHAVEKIYDKLKQLNKTDKASRKSHVRKAKAQKFIKKQSTTCPKCGSRLQLKQGKYGEFFGCSSYPKCKFTKKYNA